jgi:ABC-type sugar transport system ATPase subunit
VVKQYEGVATATVKEIDLQIRDQEFVVLVGPPGAESRLLCV